MSAGKHTRGPWLVSESADVGFDVITTEGTLVVGSQGAELLEDALLIAAAPELLEALILMVRTHDEPAESLLQEMKEQMWLTQARAAIAKATGAAQ